MMDSGEKGDAATYRSANNMLKVCAAGDYHEDKHTMFLKQPSNTPSLTRCCHWIPSLAKFYTDP